VSEPYTTPWGVRVMPNGSSYQLETVWRLGKPQCVDLSIKAPDVPAHVLLRMRPSEARHLLGWLAEQVAHFPEGAK